MTSGAKFGQFTSSQGSCYVVVHCTSRHKKIWLCLVFSPFVHALNHALSQIRKKVVDSDCQQQQSYSGPRSPGRLCSTLHYSLLHQSDFVQEILYLSLHNATSFFYTRSVTTYCKIVVPSFGKFLFYFSPHMTALLSHAF